MFRIKKLIIHPGCIGRNNLVAEEYNFVSADWEKFPKDFYGENIIVSAIVGKNGSGKSSLLDIIYRVINNVCALMCTNLNTENYTAFGYILSLKAEIHYLDSENRSCSIICNDKSILLNFYDVKGRKKKYKLGYVDNTNPEYERIIALNDIQRASILNELFYCSVVNYAPMTLNANDYHETCVGIQNDLTPGKLDLKRFNWLQAVFHKNDGYQSNITITPYREYGKFDAEKEFRLSKERILSILLVFPDFIEGYKLKKAIFRFNKLKFKDKFHKTKPTRENNYHPEMELEEFVQEFDQILTEYVIYGRKTVTSIILSSLGIKRDEILDGHYIYCYLYLVYKVLSCAKYPAYDDFKDLENPDLAISRDNDEKLLYRVEIFTKMLMTEHSHITFKIERVLNFIRILHKLNEDEFGVGFTLQDYEAALEKENINGLIPFMRILPPSYFDLDIYLESQNDSNADIELEKLSSGERLFYITICSIIYHAMNLISIPERDYRVKYRNMLVILDETEICFHPDYQRTFISRLLKTIKHLEFNKYLNFHFLITTHSPFILSDIPVSNILYLSEGKVEDSISGGFINPFSANLNDILAQSFFLKEDGFIGEAAKDIIQSLYYYLQDEKVENAQRILWSMENAKYVIEQVGEPLIRESLKKLYNKSFHKIEDIDRQIEELESLKREIKRK